MGARCCVTLVTPSIVKGAVQEGRVVGRGGENQASEYVAIGNNAGTGFYQELLILARGYTDLRNPLFQH